MISVSLDDLINSHFQWCSCNIVFIHFCLQQYLDELAELSSPQDLDSYVQKRLIAQFGLLPVLGMALLPPPKDLLPPNWKPPFPLPENFNLREMNSSTFTSFHNMIVKYREWFSKEENGTIYTWRSSLNSTDLIMKTFSNYLEVSIPIIFSCHFITFYY